MNWDTTQHLFIEGENLEVLKLLYKPYYGRVKMIYIDPPYNTGNDFIYRDDYSQPRRAYLEKTGQVDAEGNVLTSNPEASGRYHSDWLTMMYPRLFLARQLLREDGVIFVSIDDHEVHNLRLLMNELFGEEHFVADIAVVNNLKGRSDRAHIATAHEHLLMYVKSEFESLGLGLSSDQVGTFDEVDEQGRRFQWRDLRKRGGPDTRAERPNLYFPVYLNPKTNTLAMEPTTDSDIEIYPKKSDGSDGRWRWSREKVAAAVETLKASYVRTSDRWNVYHRVYLVVDGNQRTSKPKSAWIGSQYSTDLAQRAFKKLFPEVELDVPPKAVGFLKEVLQQSTAENDICLDFFAGTCATTQALLELNREDGSSRQFIMIQIPELTPKGSSARKAGFDNIADIGKERIRRVIAQMQADREGQLPLDTRDIPEDLGFRVFKLAPSNFRQWEQPDEDADALAQQLTFFDCGLEEDADLQDVVYEVILKEGYPLTSRIETLPLDTNRVYRITDARQEENPPSFYLCLDAEVHPATLDALPLDRETVLVCLDSALDDSQKVNLAKQCLLKVL